MKKLIMPIMCLVIFLYTFVTGYSFGSQFKCEVQESAYIKPE